ncbi:unnamed protein product [Urochloa humidicola]
MMDMKHTCSGVVLPDETRYVYSLKIDNFVVTIRNSAYYCIKSRCNVGGYDWEIRFYPARWHRNTDYMAALQLAFLDGAPSGGAHPHGVTASLSGRLVQYRHCHLRPFKWDMPVTKEFKDASDPPLQLFIGRGETNDVGREPSTLEVECTIGVRKDTSEAPSGPPPPDLPRHLGELLQSEAGADITFAVSGKSFAAHKNILAARSPVFKAEFFGAMEEQSAQRVEIPDMEPAVFKAMLRFIYTDMVPSELDDKQQPEEAEEEEETAAATVMAMAQHLLVAADRYGLDRLKVICEQRLILGIDIETAATTLALADRHNISVLKAKCIEFIAGRSAENLDAVMETEGYKHLEASSPSVLTELLRTANGRKRRSSNIS